MQHVIVAIIVLIAMAFSTWKLMPARYRLRVLIRIDAWAAGHPRLDGWRDRSLKPRILRAGGTGCTGCAANTQPRPR